MCCMDCFEFVGTSDFDLCRTSQEKCFDCSQFSGPLFALEKEYRMNGSSAPNFAIAVVLSGYSALAPDGPNYQHRPRRERFLKLAGVVLGSDRHVPCRGGQLGVTVEGCQDASWPLRNFPQGEVYTRGRGRDDPTVRHEFRLWTGSTRPPHAGADPEVAAARDERDRQSASTSVKGLGQAINSIVRRSGVAVSCDLSRSAKHAQSSPTFPCQREPRKIGTTSTPITFVVGRLGIGVSLPGPLGLGW